MSKKLMTISVSNEDIMTAYKGIRKSHSDLANISTVRKVEQPKKGKGAYSRKNKNWKREC